MEEALSHSKALARILPEGCGSVDLRVHNVSSNVRDARHDHRDTAAYIKYGGGGAVSIVGFFTGGSGTGKHFEFWKVRSGCFDDEFCNLALIVQHVRDLKV